MKLIKRYFEWENLFEQAKPQPNVNGGVLMIKSSTDPTKVTKEQSLNYTGIKEEGKGFSNMEYEIKPKGSLLKNLFSLSRNESGNMGTYMSIKATKKVNPGTDKLVIGDKSILTNGTIVLTKEVLEKPDLNIVASGNGLLVLARIAGAFKKVEDELTDLNVIGDYAVSFSMGKERDVTISYLNPNTNKEFFQLECDWIVWRVCLAIFLSKFKKLIEVKDVQWGGHLNDKNFVNDPMKFTSDSLRGDLQIDNYYVEKNGDITQAKVHFDEFTQNINKYLVGNGYTKTSHGDHVYIRGHQVTKEGSKLFQKICGALIQTIIPTQIPPDFVGAEKVFESYKKALNSCFIGSRFGGDNINKSLSDIQRVMQWGNPLTSSGMIASADKKNKPGEY